jgi:hypothetical protein
MICICTNAPNLMHRALNEKFDLISNPARQPPARLGEKEENAVAMA